MEEKEKTLLKRALLSYMPYDIKGQMINNNYELATYKLEGVKWGYVYVSECNKTWGYTEKRSIGGFKPYLRPMSSMTEEESEEYRMFIDYSYNDFTSENTPCVYVDKINDYLDWLNAHHFDYHGLIEKNLALDCTGLHIYD